MLFVEQLDFRHDDTRGGIASFSCTLRALPKGESPRTIYSQAIEPALRKACGWGALRMKTSEEWCSLWCRRKFRFPSSATSLLGALIFRQDIPGIDVELLEDFEDPGQSTLTIRHARLRAAQQELIHHALASIRDLQFAPAAHTAYAALVRLLSGS